ncbi:MAG: HD-GYP domain-containing protein [Pirellulales bacterium]
MNTSLTATPQRFLPTGAEAAPAVHPPCSLAERVESLRRWFGVELAMVDANSGELLYRAVDQPSGDWGIVAELCREVARRGRPEIIEAEDPFALLAIPLAGRGEAEMVAVGAFVTREVMPGEDIAASAAALRWDVDDAAAWADNQVPTPLDALLRAAELVSTNLAFQSKVSRLEAEIQDLADHLASTYEEISLLYRLTQNLKISRRDEDLARLALEWLAEVVPAQGLAVQFTPVAEVGSPTHEARTHEVLLTFGQCPLDNEQFTRLVEHMELDATTGPLVVNRAMTGRPAWPFPQVRELVVVPLAEGKNIFGWLAAFNRADDAEFGSVEANLLNSVGAILGIHSGNIELYRQHAELLTGVVRALTSAIDAKDPYTCGHSDRVARIAVRLGEELGENRDFLDTIYLTGLLHDIGKIGVSDNVLRKPGKLTEEEFEHIKTHAKVGHRILVDLRKIEQVLPGVLHHHESWDGRGYPSGLAAEDIPYLGRIVAVADAFDAMSSDRPYRNGMPDEKIDEIFRAGAGKQWDSRIVAAFFRARDDVRAIARREREHIELQLQHWAK